VGEIEHHLVDIAPPPALRRIIALNDRVAGRVKMLGRVLVRRLVAASDMAARATDSQVQPDVAGLETFLAAERARGHVANGVEMRAGLRAHGVPRRIRDADLESAQGTYGSP